MSKRLISFTESSTVIRPHIKQYLEVFIHGFDKNVGQNPALDNLSPFQNYLRQHSKTDSALHMAKHLRTVS